MDIEKFNPRNWFADDDDKNELWDKSKKNYHQSVEYMQKELDKLKDSMASAGESLPSFPSVAGKSATLLRPKVDIAENDDYYTVALEVPGVKEKDITLKVSDRTLKITGEKKQALEEEDEDFHRIERAYGKFQRVLTLPDDVDADKAEAVFEDGVVKITLPRKESAKKKSKKIELKKAA